MTPIWSATSNRPEPSSSDTSAVGEVKPSANVIRPVVVVLAKEPKPFGEAEA